MAGKAARWLAPLLLAVLHAPVAAADPLAQLDQLTDQSASEASGLALADQQAARGDLLEAIATLERLLARHPKAQRARLMQAALLCRIDDRPGGLVALAKLKKKQHAKADWAAALAACGAAEVKQ